MNWKLLAIYIFLIFAFSSANVVSLDHSKLRILDYLPDVYTFKHFVGSLGEIRNKLPFLTYPVIFKPNVCSGRGNGVKKVNNYDEAIIYLDNSKVNTLIVEEYSQLPNECGILYIKYPWAKTGFIRSMTQKVLVKDAVNYNISTSKLININHVVTPELSEVVESLCKNIPGFHYGRYDIKFDSVENLQRGIFKVIEVNGVLSCDLNFYVDNHYPSYLVEPIQGFHLMLLRVFIGIWNILKVRNYPLIIKERLQEVNDIFYCGQWKLIIFIMVGFVAADWTMRKALNII